MRHQNGEATGVGGDNGDGHDIAEHLCVGRAMYAPVLDRSPCTVTVTGRSWWAPLDAR
ncbi:MAG: hypothetical protein IPI55_19680 [Flavobacteriales bacterium]|nr:hypothetical protein [Flavobacteriales bacterium]